MSMSPADVRFLFDRVRGLIRRGLTSLRMRGWRATWGRVQRQFRRAPAPASAPLYFPAPATFAPFAVPFSEAPTASIIIPVYNQADHTLNCLRALVEHPPAARCEIIVADDGSTDETGQWLAQIPGLRYHRRAENGGFIAACNDGASLARGDYLVFLNNDTVPQPGWLDALLDTFHAHPETGLAGAQLIYPDGRLQEAGGVVFADGSAWNYGRFESPDDPRFASLRDTDYCSGAAIAIPSTLFRRIGGFDQRYAPAYYEDTDLAFAVRSLGKRVLYQPRARVVHLEGISSGTDTGSGIKAYQVRNRSVFAQKWQEALAHHLPPEALPSPANLHSGQRQILIVDAAVPQPDRDSGSLRSMNLLRLLVEQGAHVVFLAAHGDGNGLYPAALRALGVETWFNPHIGRATAWMREHGRRFDAVMLSRHHVASEFLPLLRRHAPNASVIFDTVDLHYLRESRGADLAQHAALKKSAAKTREKELRLIHSSDVTLVVSPLEQQLLADDAPGARVEILSNLHEVAGNGGSYTQRKDLVFVGGFHHPPNTDAVRWFGEQVFPLIRQRLPEVRFHCIGSDPPATILALGKQPGIEIHGHVPDLSPYMDDVRIAIAPLRFGAGVKGKVNLSMAHGQPVVATSCAVEGMYLREERDVLVADDAQAFADAVVRLYQDEALWNRLAANGLENVRQHCSLEAAREVVTRVFFPDR
jgi:GT2 family glycosyltransferase/glycosyltransferase involved in cell wall biosynthesis